MLFAGLPAFFDSKWTRQGLGLGLAVVLAASVLVAVNAQEATAQSADQTAAERCSAIHLFGAQPVDVAKTADGETVLAQASWGFGGGICYLTLDDAAVAALRAAGPPASLPSGETNDSRRCFEHHRFGAEPVDVAKTADRQTVLARLSWGFDSGICFLALDSAAIDTLRAAATPAEAPSAPGNISATAGNGQIAANWTAPADDGGAPITVYTVAYKADASDCPAALDATWTVRTTSNTSVSIDNLTNGSEYRVCARASNSAGDGDWVSTTATPAATPGAPGNVEGTTGDGQITVRWTAPADDGGFPITIYTVAYKGTTSSCPADLDSTWTLRTTSNTSISIEGLSNGTAYRLCVKATNSVGDGDWNSTIATPATTPGAPGNVEATAGDGEFTVTWTAPSSSGGAPIIDYTVAYQAGATVCPTDADVTWNPRITSETSATIEGLANGTAYRVCVKATNSAGDGPWNATTATPATLPGAPTNVEAIAGDSQLTVSWTAPADTGGAPITSYTVAYKAGAFTCPATADGTWARRTTSNTSITIIGLANDNAYQLCVRATNSAGDSTWSGTSSSPSDRPGQPTGLQFLSSGPDQLTVAWTAPVATGVSAITGYTVQWCSARNDVCASSWSTASSTGTSYTISGLTASTSYGVRVQAVNNRGTGSSSSTRFASTTAATAPSTPSGLTTSIDDRRISLQWTAPRANGAPITHYTVDCRLASTAIASGTCGSSDWVRFSTTSTTSVTISGLANGTAYEIRVSATNRAGSSGWNSVTATPAARPRIPFDVQASNSGRNITVTWTAPPSGGSPISSYTVEFCSGGCTTWRSRTVSGNPPATTTTLTGLTEGTTYRVRVRANNQAGESGWSVSDTATTPTRPGTPTNLTITTFGNDDLTATWTAPTAVSGISHYNVQRCTARANNLGVWSCISGWSNAGTATDTSHVVTGLLGSTSYSVRVQAANAAGTSGWSNTYTITTDPPTAPETPSEFTATAGNRQVRLSWTAPATNGARIQRYTITCTNNGTPVPNSNHRCDQASPDNTYTTTGTSYSISGLTNGNSYTFTVLATNSAGDSSTTSASATPATRPGQPRNIELSESYPGGGVVDLSVTWEEPSRDGGTTTDDGGSPITGYTVQYRASTGNWSFAYFGAIRGTGNALVIPGLTVGPRYYVQIRSHNAGGDSNWVQASTHPTGAPAAPAAPGVSASNLGELAVTWSAPGVIGASAITDYDVQWCTSRELVRTVNGNPVTTYPCTGGWRTAPDADLDETSVSYDITGLTGSTRYSVQVRAVNIHGNGAWSDVTSAETQAPAVPGTPSDDEFTATAGNRQVRLTWTAPAANGARITRYTITCTSNLTGNHVCDRTDGTNTYTTSGTSYTISGLTNGNSYSFTVFATNSAGDGSPTSAKTATPATRPNRPDPNEIAIVENYGTPDDGLVELSVTWVAPEDTSGSNTSGGSAITGYTLQYRASGGNWSFHFFGGGTTSTISGLSIGSRYDVQIRTHTAAGESSWAQKSATPNGRPAAPTVSSPTQGTNQVTANWSGPANQGESAITSYNVQWCIVTVGSFTDRTTDPPTERDTYSCGGWTSGGTAADTASSLLLTNLPCGRQIGVRVQAVNSYGAGPWSATNRLEATWSNPTDPCPTS